MIVSPNKDNEIRIMRLKDKKIIKILKGHSSSICHVRHFFSQKQNLIIYYQLMKIKILIYGIYQIISL